jgi:hypothetical protein
MCDVVRFEILEFSLWNPLVSLHRSTPSLPSELLPFCSGRRESGNSVGSLDPHSFPGKASMHIGVSAGLS